MVTTSGCCSQITVAAVGGAAARCGLPRAAGAAPPPPRSDEQHLTAAPGMDPCCSERSGRVRSATVLRGRRPGPARNDQGRRATTVMQCHGYAAPPTAGDRSVLLLPVPAIRRAARPRCCQDVAVLVGGITFPEEHRSAVVTTFGCCSQITVVAVGGAAAGWGPPEPQVPLRLLPAVRRAVPHGCCRDIQVLVGGITSSEEHGSAVVTEVGCCSEGSSTVAVGPYGDDGRAAPPLRCPRLDEQHRTARAGAVLRGSSRSSTCDRCGQCDTAGTASRGVLLAAIPGGRPEVARAAITLVRCNPPPSSSSTTARSTPS